MIEEKDDNLYPTHDNIVKKYKDLLSLSKKGDFLFMLRMIRLGEELGRTIKVCIYSEFKRNKIVGRRNSSMETHPTPHSYIELITNTTPSLKYKIKYYLSNLLLLFSLSSTTLSKSPSTA